MRWTVYGLINTCLTVYGLPNTYPNTYPTHRLQGRATGGLLVQHDGNRYVVTTAIHLKPLHLSLLAIYDIIATQVGMLGHEGATHAQSPYLPRGRCYRDRVIVERLTMWSQLSRVVSD